jgi:hypothetical protein
MVAAEQRASKKRLSRESFCLMATTVSMAASVSSAVIATDEAMHLAREAMPGIT